MIVLAHAGHWLIGVLQFLPVVAFVGWLVFVHIHDRRREADEDAGEAG